MKTHGVLSADDAGALENTIDVKLEQIMLHRRCRIATSTVGMVHSVKDSTSPTSFSMLCISMNNIMRVLRHANKYDIF